MGRITGRDSVQEAVVKMADGNPRAATALLNIHGRTLEIDPTIGLGQMHYLFLLDDLGVHGDTISTLYKDVCGLDVESVLTLLRAWQLGLIKRTALTGIILNGQPFDTSELLAKVRAIVPTFGAKRKALRVQDPEPDPYELIAPVAVVATAAIDVPTLNVSEPVEEKPFEGFKGGSTGGAGAGGSWVPDAVRETPVPEAEQVAVRDPNRDMIITDDIAPIEASATDAADTGVDAAGTSVEADTPDSAPDLSSDPSNTVA